MKICIMGNSVGFKLRPPRQSASEMTYSEILETQGHHVRNISKAGVMLNEAFALLDDELITFFPDLVIIHFGTVEVCYRQSLRWLNNRCIRNYYLNHVYARHYTFDGPVQRLLGFINAGLNFATREAAEFVGLKWQWLSEQKFSTVLRATLQSILKETRARIIVIGITPCSPRVERILKGSGERIQAANLAMQELVAQFPKRTCYLDPCVFLNEENLPTLAPDGIHFSAAGHRLMADAITKVLKTSPE